MKKYEMFIVLHPEMQEEEINKTIDDVQKLIVSKNGVVLDVEKWGMRDLATEFNKVTSGFYVFINFDGDNEVLTKLYSTLKVNEKVVRYLVANRIEKKEKVAQASQ